MALVDGGGEGAEVSRDVGCGDAAADEEDGLACVAVGRPVAFGMGDAVWPGGFPVCESWCVGHFGRVVVS